MVVLLFPFRVMELPMICVWSPDVPLLPLIVIGAAGAMIEPVNWLPELPLIVKAALFG